MKTLLEILSGKKINAVCGGNKLCGKCKVKATGELSPLTDIERKFLSQSEIDNGIRLACMTYPEGEYTVELLDAGTMQIQTAGITGSYEKSPVDGEYGVAVDIGTTTIAVYLCNLKSGEIEQTAAFKNPQSEYGADVITRIGYIINNADGLDKQRNAIITELNKTIKSFKKPINAVCITGNTTMEHIFAGYDPSGIANAPFTPKSLFGFSISGAESGLSVDENANVWVMPCFSAYVGGDIASGLVAADVDISGENVLYIDIGTNGEIALGSKDGIHVCSAAAGPAFEGAKIEKGMSGVNGAVSKIWLNSGEVKFNVIGDVSPIGICGSGLIDAVAVMLELGVIDETGYLDKPFYITENVYISAADIRELQLAKAAISAGILTLLEITGANVEKVIIAGGFGSFMDPDNACRIGLIPSRYKGKIKSVGNTAGAGAALYLLSGNIRGRIDNVTAKSSYTELSGNMIFMDKFIEQMYFEEE
ncbi:MAG: ASKHA domain-containing protein [Oscillospiraceae bacterium]|nr:ASKHA domain-containing protein [Oscillospiraceae bacterium]